MRGSGFGLGGSQRKLLEGFTIGDAREPNPSKPNSPNTIDINEITRNQGKQTQPTYPPCYQRIAINLAAPCDQFGGKPFRPMTRSGLRDGGAVGSGALWRRGKRWVESPGRSGQGERREGAGSDRCLQFVFSREN